MGGRPPSLWHNLQRGNNSLRKCQFRSQPYVIITPFSLVWCTYWEHDCILDLLQNKAINAQIIRGTLVLKDGSAKLFALKGLLKAHGCNFNAATNTWRRPSATVAERYAVGVLKARENTSNAQIVNEEDAIVDAILAHVNAIDARRRNAVWVGVPCTPTCEITPEARARAWTNYGLEPPTSLGGQRRDAYGNVIDP